MSTLLIPATRLVRRATAKRWHIERLDGEVMQAAAERGLALTECGQTFRRAERTTVRNARRIDCYDCLSDSVSRRLAERY
jgi:hypothetical protein